jgi:hypothetical protein
MAQTLPEFPQPHASTRGIGLYPWRGPEGWLNGQVWKITQGEDFELAPENMRAVVIARAHREGLRARTSVQGDTVTFQFYAKDEVAA